MLNPGEKYQVKYADLGEDWRDCAPGRAERILADNYTDITALAEALRDEYGVRTTFAHYRIVKEEEK